ncbi:MAG: hypothetical protein ACRETT_12060, partial [Steroidobacteraceae bacterium]
MTQFRGARVGAVRRRLRVIVNCGNAVARPANILHFVTSHACTKHAGVHTERRQKPRGKPSIERTSTDRRGRRRFA